MWKHKSDTVTIRWPNYGFHTNLRTTLISLCSVAWGKASKCGTLLAGQGIFISFSKLATPCYCLLSCPPPCPSLIAYGTANRHTLPLDSR